ncbi:MAG: DUF6600 domain-containing protein, partial [Polyangiaceae bacterium]
MNAKAFAFAVAAITCSLIVSGCAADEPEAGGAEYPESIGYTPPSLADATYAPNDPAPPPPQAPPPAWASTQAPMSTGEGSEGAAGEVDVGAPEGDGEVSYSDSDPSALTDFDSALDPYGSWADDPTYGRVWVPSASVVGSDFTPYVSAGHWDYDEDGSDYAWVSDYDWGWAPFHYGRWAYAAGPGWEWIPGRVYAGAWVSWRYGEGAWGYVGWAPLPPTWCWRGGAAVGLGFVPRAPYAFVGTHDLFAPGLRGRIIGGAQVGVIAAHTRAYIPASPGVVGRFAARPVVGGPSPQALHIAPSVLAGASVRGNRGIAEARAFSRPATAVALGARAPAGGAWRGASLGAKSVATYSARPFYPGRSTFSASRSPAESHFGGRVLGGGFAGSPASAPPMRSTVESPNARAYFGAQRGTTAPSSSYRPSPRVGSYAGFHG